MNEREFWIVILEWAVCWLLQSLWLLFIYLCMQEAQKIWDGNTWNSGRGDGSRILSWIPSPVCSHLLGSTAAEVCILLSVSVYKWECCQWLCLSGESCLHCVYTGDTFLSNSGTPSSGTSSSSPLSVTVTTTGSSPVSGPAATDAAVPSSVAQPQSSTPKCQTLNELLASIPGFSLRVRQ